MTGEPFRHYKLKVTKNVTKHNGKKYTKYVIRIPKELMAITGLASNDFVIAQLNQDLASFTVSEPVLGTDY